MRIKKPHWNRIINSIVFHPFTLLISLSFYASVRKTLNFDRLIDVLTRHKNHKRSKKKQQQLKKTQFGSFWWKTTSAAHTKAMKLPKISNFMTNIYKTRKVKKLSKETAQNKSIFVLCICKIEIESFFWWAVRNERNLVVLFDILVDLSLDCFFFIDFFFFKRNFIGFHRATAIDNLLSSKNNSKIEMNWNTKKNKEVIIKQQPFSSSSNSIERYKLIALWQATKNNYKFVCDFKCFFGFREAWERAFFNMCSHNNTFYGFFSSLFDLFYGFCFFVVVWCRLCLLFFYYEYKNKTKKKPSAANTENEKENHLI